MRNLSAVLRNSQNQMIDMRLDDEVDTAAAVDLLGNRTAGAEAAD